MKFPECARILPRTLNTAFGERRTPTEASTRFRIAALSRRLFRRYMAPVYRVASSELAAKVQFVSPAERRRSPNFATAPTTLVV